MKKLLFSLVIFLSLTFVAFGAASESAFKAEALSVSEVSAYDFSIDSYQVSMEIKPNRKVEVLERISCSFSGYSSHGIIRDFPLDGGVRYLHLKAECDDPDFSPYAKKDDSDYLSLYLRGDGLVQGKKRTYTLRYEMIVPKLEEGYLPLDVLGYGWGAAIESFSAEISFPEGLKAYNVYSGRQSARENELKATVLRQGNAIVLSANNIGYDRGITLDLKFEKGVLKTSFDFSLLLCLGIGAVLLILIIALRALCCKQPIITATVNFEAPKNMDPLLMGKLIDNTIDSEDLGALVFYLADRGYLDIDLKDEDDPLLIKKRQIDLSEPSYLRAFFDGLFSGRDRVRPSELRNHFYLTAQTAKAQAEHSAGKTFRASGFVALFAGLTLLLLGGFSLLFPLVAVFSRYFYFAGIIACALAFTIGAFGGFLARQREFKWTKAKCVFSQIAAFLLSALFAIIFLFQRCPAFGVWTGVLLTLFAGAAGVISGGAVCRTKEYAEKLGQILGFKQFLLYTERDKVEFMLKDDPALYYHVLPFAQVLGVTDEWTEKFKGLNVSPPSYLTGRADLFDVLVFSSLYRNVSIGMAQSFVSKPSPSGGGGHSGSFGGGFGGGGFGGGGGRGC